MKSTDSILQMARGAFVERVDYEMHKVINNILDPNTKATAKRKIILTIELVPDDERQQINVQVTAKSTLAEENDDELPEEFEGLVNVYTFNDVTRRKARTFHKQ